MNKNILKVMLLAAPLFLLTACEKSDNYIDWKVINQNWYEKHKNDGGFTVTESGLCYRRIGQPANPAERKPNMTDIVYVDYTGQYIDGNEFDSGTNAPFSLSDVVSGFQEGLLKMRHGETYEFYIPYQIGYGTTSQGAIPPYSTLIFRIKLNYSVAN